MTKDLGVLQTLQLLVAKPLLSLELKCKNIKRDDKEDQEDQKETCNATESGHPMHPAVHLSVV